MEIVPDRDSRVQGVVHCYMKSAPNLGIPADMEIGENESEEPKVVSPPKLRYLVKTPPNVEFRDLPSDLHSQRKRFHLLPNGLKHGVYRTSF